MDKLSISVKNSNFNLINKCSLTNEDIYNYTNELWNDTYPEICELIESEIPENQKSYQCHAETEPKLAELSVARSIPWTSLTSTQVSPAGPQKYCLPDTPVSLPSPAYPSASRAPETVGLGSLQIYQNHVAQVSLTPSTIVSSGEYQNNLVPGAAVSTFPPTYPMRYNCMPSPSFQYHQRHHPASYEYACGNRTHNTMTSGPMHLLDDGLSQNMPPANTDEKPRRQRTTYTPAQRKVLEELYEKEKYPSIDLRMECARRINIEEARVEIWFKNRRAKCKQQAAKRELQRQKLYSTTSRCASSNESEASVPMSTTFTNYLYPVPLGSVESNASSTSVPTPSPPNPAEPRLSISSYQHSVHQPHVDYSHSWSVTPQTSVPVNNSLYTAGQYTDHHQTHQHPYPGYHTPYNNYHN